MATSKAEGSQTAVIDTEHTLATVTDAGTYEMGVNTKNMVLGDKLTLRVFKKIRSGGSSELLDIGFYAHVQGIPAKVSIPVLVVSEVIFTLEQTAGTGRAFDWEIAQA